jgi:hypothetical protein
MCRREDLKLLGADLGAEIENRAFLFVPKVGFEPT